MVFVVSGGGTGGHIYPALAIARGLGDRFGAEVYYIGGTRGMESDIVPREGLPFRSIPLAGFKRGLSLSNIAVGFKALSGIRRAWGYLKEIKPDAVIGTGGYVCGPVVLAAALSGIPTLIHEQNAFPGLTNRMLARFSGCVAATFEESKKFFPAGAPVRVTGLPVRKQIFKAERDKAREKLGLSTGRLFVVSFGGSQGARSINNAMLSVLGRFYGDDRISFLHVPGPGNYADFMESLNTSIKMDEHGNITITPYLHDMPTALSAADLVVCRAGAATCAELAIVGLPAILVPYPHAAGNHQEHNALALEKKGAAVVIRDGELGGSLLAAEIERLVGGARELKDMSLASRNLGRPRALDDILDCVQVLLDNKRKKRNRIT
ncbi:MAG: UDP-diphospho-muramoylpentapeptide beta-N-acetylglucosaminyltransferase [Peptococcaceae bacterium BICA1-7]|nr:MAG: UDP-diphospho-muramoylpentapeptide beta-N-acetylglucosaminyltransferase [Peptococcaceae bacterium BICA1-7]HBV99003.1 undecaprenyldiphospho-muramoylpentapeptide beta-N-acetylglucosaminyltransferase [Desulfotomaculum sp.]